MWKGQNYLWINLWWYDTKQWSMFHNLLQQNLCDCNIQLVRLTQTPLFDAFRHFSCRWKHFNQPTVGTLPETKKFAPEKNAGKGRWNGFLLKMVSFLRGGSGSFSEILLSGSLTAHPLKSYQFTIPKSLPTYPFFRGQLAVKLQDCNFWPETAAGQNKTPLPYCA